MAEFADYLPKNGYLLVKVAAAMWTEASARQVIDQTKEEADRLGHERILLDLTQWTKPDAEFTRFFTGVYLAKTLPPPFRVAGFALEKLINKFGENTAVNRGADCRIFPEEAMALSWLLE